MFLLSITEANDYFSTVSASACKPTDYAVSNGVNVNSDNGNCVWWLRSPGRQQNIAADIYIDGAVDFSGFTVSNSLVSVRPAMWIDYSYFQ